MARNPALGHMRAGRSLQGLAIMLTCALVATAWAAPLEVRIAYLGARDADAYRGAMQGIEEANAQGKFLGQHYTLAAVDDAAAALALPAAVIVADLPAARLPAAAAAAADTPLFNVSAVDDALRTACIANLFHTIPSTGMLSDAVQQWRRKAPGSPAVAQAWHADFEKYAAVQLNNRYRERHGRPMTDTAWAAWAAVKLMSDSVARLQNADPAALAQMFKTDLAFDGQKGVDMSFRATGQLRQPLLLVEGGRVVGEAPVRDVVGGAGLDSLGPLECAK